MRLDEELEGILLSDLSAGAVRLWTWLRMFNPNGAGMGLVLGEMGEEFTALYELEALEMVSIDADDTAVMAQPWTTNTEAMLQSRLSSPAFICRNLSVGTLPTPKVPKRSTATGPRSYARTRARTIEGLRGPARLRASLTAPDSEIAKETIGAACRKVFKAYNTCRVHHGVQPVHKSQRDRMTKYLVEIVRFCAFHDVDYGNFFGGLYKGTKWMKTKFPALSVCSGPWAQDMYLSGRSSKRSGHAGHSYRDPSVTLKRELTDGGADEDVVDALTPALLRFIDDMARAEADMPGSLERDPEYGDLVDALLRARS